MNRMPPAVEMDVVVEPSAPRLRQPRRHPILRCRRKAQRRRFTAAYRLRILKQSDACKPAWRAGGAAAPRRLV